MKHNAVTVSIKDLRKLHAAREKLFAAITALAKQRKVVTKDPEKLLGKLAAKKALKQEEAEDLRQLLKATLPRMCRWGRKRRAEWALQCETAKLFLQRLSI